MKRYVCTVAAGLLLALVSTGIATASLIPAPVPPTADQAGTQATSFGDQTVGEQTNYADVTQAQGNGNVNVSPAIAIFGDAETTSHQGNDNTAIAHVDQDNAATQTQSSEQTQTQEQDANACCADGQSQTGEQSAEGGDQTVGEQKNDAEVNQYQGNGNVNVSPAIAIGGSHGSCDSKCGSWGFEGGDASTKNAQGNGNTAVALVDQSNEANQSQSSEQKQTLEQSDGGCCGPRYDSWGEKEACCDDGQSQAGRQEATFGDQTIGEQKNDADVNQYQGNGNVNVSPAIAIGGNASTRNYQGNHNKAVALVDQSNSAEQSQSAEQTQTLEQEGSGCCEPKHECERPDPCEPEKGWGKHEDSCCDREHECCDDQDQTGEQHAYFGDQYVGKQKNAADVTQKQGNDNLNVSPALAFGGKQDRCYSKCDAPRGGDASTKNAQGNGNKAVALVRQSNTAEQSQHSDQWQRLVQKCKEVISL